MRIIVIGAGKVGFTIAEHLIAEEHDVIIIDKNEEVVERCTGEQHAGLSHLQASGRSLYDRPNS